MIMSCHGFCNETQHALNQVSQEQIIRQHGEGPQGSLERMGQDERFNFGAR